MAVLAKLGEEAFSGDVEFIGPKKESGNGNKVHLVLPG